VLKYCAKTPLFHEDCMLTLRIIVGRYALITAIFIALALTNHQASAQAPYDIAARVSLSNEINQTYGSLVTPALSITELFDSTVLSICATSKAGSDCLSRSINSMAKTSTGESMDTLPCSRWSTN
jgi:hypothetical protein